MTGVRGKAGVDLPRLARTDPVNCGLHIVEYPALRHTAQNLIARVSASNSISWVCSRRKFIAPQGQLFSGNPGEAA